MYSWVGLPLDRSADVIRSLRPNGVIVFEGRGEWVPEDRLRNAFGGLRTIRYERVRETGTDSFKSSAVLVVRFVAQRPE